MLFCRFEKGAESQHAHLLIAGIPEKYDPYYFAADFERHWRRRNGDCKVEQYDPAKDGVGYVTKSSGTDEDRDLARPYMSPALIEHLKERANS